MAAPPDLTPPIAALTPLVVHNLENQHDWTEVRVHDLKPGGLARQLVSGLPPQRVYVHPDEQVAIIRAEKKLAPAAGGRIPQPPEYEWVLPVHLSEKWTLARFADVFDAIEAVPPSRGGPADATEPNGSGSGVGAGIGTETEWKQWRSSKRGKRIILAAIQNDSTIVYYLMHDGIVKPRQN